MKSYVGFDVSLAETSVCMLDASGKVRFEGKVQSRPEDLVACIREHAGDAERIGLETGQTAALLFRAMEVAALPVVCIETRHAHKVLSARSNKTDRNDARGLAELVRVGWYREAWVRGAAAHAIRSLLLGRRTLLATKRTLENTLRGAVKRFGLIITKTAGRTFTHRATAALEREPPLSAFTASIRCGHSFLNPANQTPTVTKALFDQPDRLPFAFTWLDGHMIVTADLGSGHRVAPGTEIVAIDQLPTREILARMLLYARTDGSNDARKIADLGIPGDAEQPSFDILRALLFPASASSARLDIRTNGQTRTIVCPLMTAADRHAALNRPSADAPYGWRFAVRGNSGILTMPTWAVFHEKWDWQGFIDTSIDTAIDRKLSGIVIDLRNNGGGLDCGAAILERLIAAPLATDSYSRHVRYRAIPERLPPISRHGIAAFAIGERPPRDRMPMASTRSIVPATLPTRISSDRRSVATRARSWC